MKKGEVNPLMIGGIVVAIVVLVIGIMMMKNQSNSQVAQAPAVAKTSPAVAGMESTAQNVNVEAGSFYYKPNEIRVKKGQTVKITMNSVSMMHDFVIDELNVKMPIVKNGETGTVEFVADTVGTFEYYCSVGQHRANGQVGKLIVEE